MDDLKEQKKMKVLVQTEMDEAVKGIVETELTKLYDDWQVKRTKQREERHKLHLSQMQQNM